MSEEKVISDQLSVSSKNAEQYFFRASAEDFKKIPGSPVAYWVSDKITATFDEPNLSSVITTEGQNKTANNDKYVRTVWEVSRACSGRGKKWLIYSKGGDYRKWYGNIEYVVDWSESSRHHYRQDSSCRIIKEKYWFKEGVTWTDITSSGTGFRYLPENTTFDMSGPTAFFKSSDEIYDYLCLLNSVYVKHLLPILNPTLHAQLRDIKSIPQLLKVTSDRKCGQRSKSCLLLSKKDWDAYERSWDFTTLPLLNPQPLAPSQQQNQADNSVSSAYSTLRQHWQTTTLEMQRLEQENNRIFIDAYGLQDELTPEVPLKEITLTCNPHYRYGGKNSEEELEAKLLADTMREFISYAVGCMFGRYSLDKEGLILANQGETLADYFRITGTAPTSRSHAPAWECRLNSDDSSVGVTTRERGDEVLCTFEPDDDNVIPLIDVDGDWFEDDISERFKVFLKVSFGEAHFAENIAFIEEAIGKSIKKFFLKDFYSDHVKRYKKRPIYWLFSSPKGSFNALIYMHRYRPDTVSVVLNDYLREFRTKLEAKKASHEQLEVSATASAKEKTQAIKSVQKINKVLDEINDYEHELLYPLAGQNIAIDLDDGVKHNYPLFGRALKKIPGLS